MKVMNLFGAQFQSETVVLPSADTEKLLRSLVRKCCFLAPKSIYIVMSSK